MLHSMYSLVTPLLYREFGLTSVVTERYGLLDASYFAVAVVKADSGITSLAQLKGKTSCHTGIDRTAGLHHYLILYFTVYRYCV